MKLRSIDTLGVEGLTVELRNGMGPYPMTWPEFDRLLSEVNECRPKEEKKMSEHVGVQVIAGINRIQIWAVSDENHYRIVVTPDQARKIQHEISLAFEILARNKPENPVQDKTTEEVVNERLSEVERQQIGLSLVHNHLIERINEQENFTPRLEERIEILDNHFKNMPTLTAYSAHMKLEKRIEALEQGHKLAMERLADCTHKLNDHQERLTKIESTPFIPIQIQKTF